MVWIQFLVTTPVHWCSLISSNQGFISTSPVIGSQSVSDLQWWAKWRILTFDLYPCGGGAWGAGTNMWHPETPASYESLPAPLATQIPTLWIHSSVGWGRGGALILDRCRASDLFASVDAHLCLSDDQMLTAAMTARSADVKTASST